MKPGVAGNLLFKYRHENGSLTQRWIDMQIELLLD